ncbi:MAG: radical SAM protein [Alphaproteobacteria bacterium]
MGQLYSSAKVLWFPDRLAALRRGEPVAPVHVRIKPTNVCNHSCYFCAYRSSNLSLGQEMKVRDRIPRAKMMEIIDDLVAMGVRAVTFSGGGEPLIYPHIAEAVRRLDRGGIKVATLTNGSRLLGKVADAFAECATWVRVSIDGWDGESYARYRDVKRSEFDKVLGNLEAFARRDTDCVLGASLIVDRDNAARIHGLCRRLKACGTSRSPPASSATTAARATPITPPSPPWFATRSPPPRSSPTRASRSSTTITASPSDSTSPTTGARSCTT